MATLNGKECHLKELKLGEISREVGNNPDMNKGKPNPGWWQREHTEMEIVG